MHPQALHDLIYARNKAVFDQFLQFPKPVIAAINGPAIGASVTTATLCDALLVAEAASLSTPFARLGVPPEGCSSVLEKQCTHSHVPLGFKSLLCMGPYWSE